MKRVFLPVILLTVLCMGCSGITIELPEQTQEIVLSEPVREVLFFTTKGCPPCEAAKPRVEEIKEQGLKVTEVWYHERPEMFRQYGVDATPTFIILEDGIEVERTSDIVLLITILAKVLAWILPFLI